MIKIHTIAVEEPVGLPIVSKQVFQVVAVDNQWQERKFLVGGDMLDFSIVVNGIYWYAEGLELLAQNEGCSSVPEFISRFPMGFVGYIFHHTDFRY